MLLTRSIFTISCVLFSIVTAMPIQPRLDTQKIIIDSLTEYYETVVDQSMYEITENTLLFIPDSISQGDEEVRRDAEQLLDRHLNFIRDSLMASIHPLVLTDTSLMQNFQFIQHQLLLWSQDDPLEEDLEDALLDFISTLNQRLSHQLGILINAKETSQMLIKQATRMPGKSTVISVEWELRNPLQVHVIREQERTKEYTKETEWLFEQLVAIEDNLLIEFDDRVNEALQIIKDTFALNIYQSTLA